MTTVLIFTVKENDNNYFTFSEEAFAAFCKENNLTETGYGESNKGIPDETIKVGEGVWAYDWNTYDIAFNDSENSNNKGFKESLDYCKNYIAQNNGTNNSYFADYKGGTVSIICNETEETVFETGVK